MMHLILGGAKSGKSRHAQTLATALEAQGKQVVYLVTALALDDEMRARIVRHRLDRPSHWQVQETPLELVDELSALAERDDLVVVVDCLTLWLTNVLLDGRSASSMTERLLAVLDGYRHDVLLVGNETGLGVVPMGELTRRFVDENGLLHQRLAQQAYRVSFCVAGLVMPLK